MQVLSSRKATASPRTTPRPLPTSSRIEIGDVRGARLYYSSIDQRPDGLYMTSSRAIGVVGIADEPGGGGTDRRRGRRRHPGSRGPPAGHRHRTAHPEADSTHEADSGQNPFHQEDNMQLNDIKRVLISVTDKKGIVEFAQGTHRLRRGDPLHRRNGGPAQKKRGPGHRGVGLHRLSGDDGRKAENPASEDPRRTSGAPGQRGAYAGPPGTRDQH